MITSCLVEVREALGGSYRQALESHFLWRETHTHTQSDVQVHTHTYRGFKSFTYAFCADRIPQISTRLLTGSNGGRLKGAVFQPRKNSSGVWNCSPRFRAN